MGDPNIRAAMASALAGVLPPPSRPIISTMVRPHLLAWQRADYHRFHQNPLNRALHLVGVPLFMAGTLLVPYALATAQWSVAALGPLAMVVGFGLQGLGHTRLEGVPSVPFEGAADAVTRIFAEQFITFWRFVFSGFAP